MTDALAPLRETFDAPARLDLATEFLQEDRAGEALELLAPPAPPAPAWGLQRVLALIQLGRLGEARAELDALGDIEPALAPLAHWRRVLMALAEGDPARARRAAEAMEAALPRMGPRAAPEHGVLALYDLAKFWSSRGAPARAMRHWREAHRRLARFEPFSRERHRAFVNASISAFSRTRLHEGARAGNRDPAPVFVVGMPRSGTTLIEQILGAHRDAFAAGERTALGQAFLALGGERDDVAATHRIAALEAGALDAAASAYLAELHALAPGRVIDKMPGNALYLGLVSLLLPGARIVHCRRDPRDIGLSIFTFRFHGAHGYAHDLGDLGWTIGEHERLMAHWKRALPSPVLEVKLSDWVEDFDATLARVLDHVGLPPDENCARFHQQETRVGTVSRKQVREPVNARGLGRWRAYEKELAPLIAELDKAGALEGWA
jgi:tetratricopeptide (TPR) repeat protein